ncbi:hypothetical protein [Aureibaculum conchae]|uniref:hypothetical protein n=1 Tax=Aureibaculum sp. 2308TA14-22 TaxID=3108392 RepID=UPI00339085DA
MKKTLSLIILVFCLQSCTLQSEYSKNDALVQSFECLKIKQELGEVSNLRNPYLMKLGEVLRKDSIPNKSLTDKITMMSTKIDQTITSSKKRIVALKSKHKDTRFFDATLEYLELNEKLEAKNTLLFSSFINPNRDRDKEMLLGQEVGTLTQQVMNEQAAYKKKESEFHNDYAIVQREVDSIISVIRN